MDNQIPRTFSISSASRMTGVTMNRIRDWHDKGFLPDVQMLSVGSRLHRRFTQTDLQLIMRIKDFQGQGYVISMAAVKARQGNNLN
jgi:DNA-binding transcriptional MerR regulator